LADRLVVLLQNIVCAVYHFQMQKSTTFRNTSPCCVPYLLLFTAMTLTTIVTLIGDPSLIVMCCYSCTCAGGFEGDRCETNIDDCPGHRCQNNATCLDGIDGYTCTCLPGFTGDQALIVRSGTDLISLLILFFLLFLLGRPLQKSPRLRRFKSDRDEIWQDCSSSKFVTSDFRFDVTLSRWRP